MCLSRPIDKRTSSGEISDTGRGNKRANINFCRCSEYVFLPELSLMFDTETSIWNYFPNIFCIAQNTLSGLVPDGICDSRYKIENTAKLLETSSTQSGNVSKRKWKIRTFMSKISYSKCSCYVGRSVFQIHFAETCGIRCTKEVDSHYRDHWRCFGAWSGINPETTNRCAGL